MLEVRIKTALGELMFANMGLQTQIEQLQARVAELEKAEAERPKPKTKA